MERECFPRRHLGESLSPGVLPLLETVGAGPAIEQASYPRVRKVSVRWDEVSEREDPAGRGMLVDRGHFDRLLLEHARSCGVRIMQPATVAATARQDGVWEISIAEAGRRVMLAVPWLADASGRAGARPSHRGRSGPRTLAVYGYWTGDGLPDCPRIEAGDNEWFWGVPLPDGTYNTLVFLDPRRLRSLTGTLVERFQRLLAASSLLPQSARAHLVGPIHATDATPYFDEACVTEDSIKVGDAAVAVDPISSSGVQKAIQSALAGSVVLNTMLRRPDSRAVAQRFYRESLRESAERHARWAGEHYSKVAALRPTDFWRDRASAPPSPASSEAASRPALGAGAALQLSPGVEIVELPCIVDRFIEERPAVRSPSWSAPVAYVGDLELAPLVARVRPGMTLPEIAQAWRPRVPAWKVPQIAQWLFSQGLIVTCAPSSVELIGGQA